MAFLLPIFANDFAISQLLANVPATTAQPDFRITGFPEYADSVGELPPEQQRIINRLAERIVSSQSEFTPIVAFVITGHADKDLRENNPHRKHGETHAQFELRISGARASRAREALLRKIRLLSRGRPARPLLEKLLNDPKRTRIVPMGATDLLHPNPQSEADRKLNRRVEIFLVTALVLDPDPDPPQPKPDPTSELPKRLTRCVELLNRRRMPSGPVQTQRMKCIFSKLRDNPNVNDLFVDSHDAQPVLIKGKQLDGLQNVILSYGDVSNEELEQFFLHAKAAVLSGPDFDTTASDDAAAACRRVMQAPRSVCRPPSR